MGVSAAMIVRDSERCISRCLDSIITAVDEIVIVDTGSTDQTVAIIESYAQGHEHIRLYHFDWINDFSAARNYSLEQVTNKWVFVVDSDDVLPAADHDKIRSYVNAYDSLGQEAVFDIIYDNTLNGEIVEVIPVGYVRLFPSRLRYRDMIHEQITFGDMPRLQSDIHLLHDGYDINLVDVMSKKKRNIELLIQNLKADNDNARLWLHLGREMSVLDKEKALRYLKIAVSKTTNSELLVLIRKEIESIS
ncbi:glycosyltransferase family 2 protein [Paenibacillus sp. PSB04]|uniref:glycosyltransferase family 2 protein n=1 Tax=Paenibacillus sp. PSB04 TaxID=2866810 RepID=UPI0021F10AB3|nr:glycosyltransferase family 2 protein [Paenibacillus sp. PSB04]UYO05188.1 glycosyltransferase family 2 protein [Paenibacillus sp. PSB04]